MTRQLRIAGSVIALVVFVLLSCSPELVVRGIVGEPLTSPTFEPTSLAQVATPSPTQTSVPTSTPTNVPPTATVVASPAAPVSPAATNTAPPVLPLRTDLPALALKDWPRPANDNGRCIHFLPVYYYTPRDFEIQIPRMKDLQIRWVLALYGDENQLRLAARQFKDAGIVPIWRKNLRAFQRYYAWDRDIKILNEIGLPPYFQLYNEPDTDTEWEGRSVDRDQWVSIFVQTAKDVYNAGGFVGIQTLDENWLRAVLQSIKAQKGERLFTRMFYVPHPYGLNHPPNYTEDDAGVLGFRTGVNVFQQEVGFVPPVIAGEGGWKYKANEDSRFPMIDDKLHAQYHVELFNWFRLGKLSDGQPLPDYLFAFCPWILAGQMEGAAWYDSFEGERTQTIADVKKIPIFTRKFTWDKK
jgi:hypothetical protein